MERIELNKNCKRILLELNVSLYSRMLEDIADLYILQAIDFIEGSHTKDDDFVFIRLTDYGKAYLSWNPELKNPSIWDDDTKYWITTAGSAIAIIISIIALCK